MDRAGVVFRVWGCRGSASTSHADTHRYGGETTCFEIISGQGERLMVDCGSGLRQFGLSLEYGGTPQLKRPQINVLLTHHHLDHLMGLGLFAPLLNESAEVVFWSEDAEASRASIDRLFSPPIWPVKLTQNKLIAFRSLAAHDNAISGFMVRPFQLRHPGGAVGYEIRIDNRKIVIATDHETGDAVLDAGVHAASTEADLLVFDAPYSEEEYANRLGWGHSPRSAALAIATKAKARRLLLTHHDPGATDSALDHIASQLGAAPLETMLARDGLLIRL